MNATVILNLIAIIFYVASSVLTLFRIRQNRIHKGAGIFAMILLFIPFFVCISNILEHSGISSDLDEYEGFAKDLFALFLLIFLYVDSMQKSQEKRMLQEKQIQKDLVLKSKLLTEIHHRVNNNLQIVSGLLSMQSESQKNPHLSEFIKIAQNRIQAIASVHKTIYVSPNLIEVDAYSILLSILGHLKDAYSLETRNIDFIESLDTNLQLDVDIVMPLSLILNELVTNSIKHAFIGEKRGTIQIDLHVHEDSIELVVKDDGIGIASLENSEQGIGIVLVQSLAQQIRGQISFVSQSGTKISILLPKDNHHKARF